MTIVETRAITGGVDTHLDAHVAAALDAIGGVLGVESFLATPDGYRELFEWMSGFGPVTRVGVEGTGAYGAGLSRLKGALISHDEGGNSKRVKLATNKEARLRVSVRADTSRISGGARPSRWCAVKSPQAASASCRRTRASHAGPFGCGRRLR